MHVVHVEIEAAFHVDKGSANVMTTLSIRLWLLHCMSGRNHGYGNSGTRRTADRIGKFTLLWIVRSPRYTVSPLFAPRRASALVPVPACRCHTAEQG